MTISVPKGKVRSPWMGISVPGARPIVLDTEQARAALAGVTITDVALLQANANGKRGLKVSFSHGRGHGRTTFYDRGPCALSIHDWAEKQRARRANGNGNALSPKARQAGVVIRRLEKEKRSLYVRRPVNPLLPRESHIYESSDRYLRESEKRWHDEKSQRRQLAQIAGLVLKRRVTNTTGYQMLRDAGFQFDRFSDLRKHDRDWITNHAKGGDDACYWQQIYRFTHGLLASLARAKDYVRRDPDEGDEFDRHRARQREYLADKRQAASLDSQIESLRQLAA